MGTTSQPPHQVTLLHPSIKDYEWGKRGQSSVVAQLAAKYLDKQTIDESKPYAELWMGTHPSGHSTCPEHSHKTLHDHLDQQELPYLFKVLSIQKALSIQAHPDKKLAERLHKQQPDNYKDDNHKPEMAIAVTPFSGMCGFRGADKIIHYLQTVQELQSIIGQSTVEKFNQLKGTDTKAAIKHLFSALMNVNTTTLEQYLPPLIQRLQQQYPNYQQQYHSEATQQHGSENSNPNTSSVQMNGNSSTVAATKNGIEKEHIDVVDLNPDLIVLTLYDDFKADVGVLCPYILNCVSLQPGGALFLGPNIPHAYLSGDIIECMAQSDNVVRAGLTPKYRDVENLIEMLTYESGHVTQLHPTKNDSHSKLYAPSKDFPEFACTAITLSSNDGQYKLPSTSSHCILLTYNGNGELQSTEKTLDLTSGTVAFIPADTTVTVTAAGNKPLILYRCSANNSK